jgi:hypothetical protein
MNRSSSSLDRVVIPAGENAGRPLAGLAETNHGRRWLHWALRWPGWDQEFRETLEAYAKTRAPLIYRGWHREQKGES